MTTFRAESDLRDVTILITSFLRPKLLYGCLASIKRWNFAKWKVIIVDDGDLDLTFPDPGELSCTVIPLAFDSGLAAKRNAGVQASETKYTLIAADDFDFSGEKVIQGIANMREVLELFGPDNQNVKKPVVVAGGRVDGRPYEHNIEFVPGKYIREKQVITKHMMDGDAQLCDLTVNYFLGRTYVMKKFPWPADMKIGGEHICFFLDLKLSDLYRVAYVCGAEIKTFPHDPTKEDPRYSGFRARARSLGHPLMLKRYDIQEYFGC